MVSNSNKAMTTATSVHKIAGSKPTQSSNIYIFNSVILVQKRSELGDVLCGDSHIGDLQETEQVKEKDN